MTKGGHDDTSILETKFLKRTPFVPPFDLFAAQIYSIVPLNLMS